MVDMIVGPENPTPTVKISGKANPNADLDIYLELERYNPFGTIKDRIALSMLRGIEIKQGRTLAEPSSVISARDVADSIESLLKNSN